VAETWHSRVVTDSRVGYAWDRKVAEPYPAMLRDTGDRLELVIPFDSTDAVLERRYVGDLVRWGDDPDLTRYDYELPDEFWFWDAHGVLNLIDADGRTVSPLSGGPTQLSECRIRVGFAVSIGDPSLSYSKVNGLLSEMDGLATWFGRRMVDSPLLERPVSGGTVDVSVRSPELTALHRSMNLSMWTSASWSMSGGPGRTLIDEHAQARTLLDRARPWHEHLDLHLAVHELLQISAWKPLRFSGLKAMLTSDARGGIDGEVRPRWAEVTTYGLPDGMGAGHLDFLFLFEDIGTRGIHRWLKLRNTNRRGIGAMTFGIVHGTFSLDGLVSDAGIGLEEIGYRIGVDRGINGRRGHHELIKELSDEVEDLLPFDGTDWASTSTSVYNDVKHADRREPDPDLMVETLRQDRMVFRLWLARRLGVSRTRLRAQQWRLER
jgi:hypothetical protein